MFGLVVNRLGCTFHSSKSSVINVSRRWAGTIYYRRSPKLSDTPPLYMHATNALAGFTWWWILWHMWHDYMHIFTGDGLTPDPSLWTDEELGISPDSED